MALLAALATLSRAAPAPAAMEVRRRLGVFHQAVA